jgi:hypothetical protein
MILTRDDGIVARTPQDAEQAEAVGYVKCDTFKDSLKSRQGSPPCNFFISPEAQSAVEQAGGYYTCPICQQSHDLLHHLPWHGVPEDEFDQRAFTAGGGTRIGLGLDVQSQIGENLVEQLGEIPGYGPITWWHAGGSTAASPLDGATEEWGIEVKTLGYDAMHHRFIPGRVKEKNDKNKHALDMGKKGVLGVLVLLDYRRSVADIFVREYPVVAGNSQGLYDKGIGAFRSHQGQHLVKEVPFKNPLMDPHDPSPTVKGVEDQEMPF